MFKQALKQVVDHTDGGLGALIMGADGLPVEKFFNDEGATMNLDVAAAEFTSLVRGAMRSGAEMNLGELRELLVSMGEVILVMRLFSKEYFAVLAIKPEGNLGRGRYELRKAELSLAKEFAL